MPGSHCNLHMMQSLWYLKLSIFEIPFLNSLSFRRYKVDTGFDKTTLLICYGKEFEVSPDLVPEELRINKAPFM